MKSMGFNLVCCDYSIWVYKKDEVCIMSTDIMPADVMTKALSRVKMQSMCSMLGLK